MYADNPDGASSSLVYGDVAVMFLFQGFYSIAWTPLLYLYPPEVMDYPIRANGLAFSQFMLNALAYAPDLCESAVYIPRLTIIGAYWSSSCQLAWRILAGRCT